MSHTACRALAAGVTLGLALLTVACDDRPVPTAPTDPSALTPGLDKASSSGAQVERTDFPFGFAGGGDPRDNLAFFVGPLDPVAAAALKCPDPDVIAPVSPGARAQIVTVPTGRVQVRAITREAHIAVWQFTGPVTSTCPLVSAPVVATGIVHYTVTTTDADAFGGAGGPGAATWHVNAVGVVDLTSGGQARLHATARILVLPDGSLRFDEERVRLTPL
jgi:hypothetical protein